MVEVPAPYRLRNQILDFYQNILFPIQLSPKNRLPDRDYRFRMDSPDPNQIVIAEKLKINGSIDQADYFSNSLKWFMQENLKEDTLSIMDLDNLRLPTLYGILQKTQPIPFHSSRDFVQTLERNCHLSLVTEQLNVFLSGRVLTEHDLVIYQGKRKQITNWRQDYYLKYYDEP
jgi:hypothetical protein